jgi:hypothetical protein
MDSDLHAKAHDTALRLQYNSQLPNTTLPWVLSSISQFSTDNAVAKAQHKATVQTLNKHINVDNDLECLEQFVDSLFVSLLSFLS